MKNYITKEQALKEGNSSINQEIKSKFVGIHVYCNVNQMVQYILNTGDPNAPFTFDDVTNWSSYPEYYGKIAKFEGGTYEELQEYIRELRERAGQNESEAESIGEDIRELEDLHEVTNEIYEWWQVSDFLCEKLNEKGHSVITDFNIWGRGTTGQAILLDYVITEICADMGILAGQENAWICEAEGKAA